MEEGELRQALAVLDSYNAQLESLNQQVRLLQLSLEETNRARNTLNAIVNAEEGDEILVPIGASSFVPAKVTGKKIAIVGIGSRVSVEKNLDEAVKFMEKNSADISDALKRAMTALTDLEKVITDLSMAIQNEYQNMNSPQ